MTRDTAAADTGEWRVGAIAVLMSGGLDSAILLGELARTARRIVPIHVRFGLVWEEEEERVLRRYLAALGFSALEALVVLEMPIRAVYGDHWSTTGAQVPGYDTPDEAVFLPGRNPLLLVEAAIWCHLNDVPTLALGPLAANPFPDSTDAFFSTFEKAMNLALDGKLRITRPYARLHKVDVLRRGENLPLGLTLSCIRPIEGRHCGDCNKCHERQVSFRAAGIPDPTDYARLDHRGTARERRG